jgi:hypothetical protein
MPIPTRARTSALGGYVTGHGMVLIVIGCLVLCFWAWRRSLVGIFPKSAAQRFCRNYNVFTRVLKRCFKKL